MLRTSSVSLGDGVDKIEDADAFANAFDVGELIGNGAAGSVYLCSRKNRRSHKAVLKKIIMPNLRSAGPALKEVQVLSQLAHLNITRYFGSWHAGNCLHILMEYADGGSLADTLRRRDPETYFDEDVVLDWFVQIARAVQYIHDLRIVHRDLKAANVLLTKRGIIKVCDFGIAKVLENTEGGSEGFARTCVGTPYYLSPEVIHGKPYGRPTDIWSLGVLLYEMAALKKPFEAESLPALALRITEASAADLPPRYSQELCDLSRQLLQAAPEKRPTAAEIMEVPLVRECEVGFASQLQELAELTSPRASLQSPPGAALPETRPPTVAPPSSGTAKVSSPPPQQHEHVARAGTGPNVLGRTDQLHVAPEPVPKPGAGEALPQAVSQMPQPSCTLGHSAGKHVAQSASSGVETPVRGASLPVTASPAFPGAEDASQDVGSGVHRLLRQRVSSEREERALACRLRTEALQSHCQSGALTPHELRTSMVDIQRFAVNMHMLEASLVEAGAGDAVEGCVCESDGCGSSAQAPYTPGVADDTRPAGVSAQPDNGRTETFISQQNAFVTVRSKSRRGLKSGRTPVSAAHFRPRDSSVQLQGDSQDTAPALRESNRHH